jgi:transcriptional regulator with XRE-family HTH domain
MDPPDKRASDPDFAPRLREALQTRGVTNHELALRVGVSDNTVSSWVRGTFHPRYPHLVEIADALEMEIADVGRDARSSEPAVAADAIVDRLASLDLEPAIEALNDAVPDLLRVLQDARRHVRRSLTSES